MVDRHLEGVVNIHRTLFKMLYVTLQGLAIISAVCLLSYEHWIGGAALAVVAIWYQLLWLQADKIIANHVNMVGEK